MYIWLRKRIGKKVPRILVTAPSNAAADVIFLKLLAEVEEDPTVVVRRTGERSKFSQRVLSTVEKDEISYCLLVTHDSSDRLRKSVAEFVSAIAYNDQQGVMEQAETGNWEKTLSLPEICVFSGDSWEEKKADCTFSHENHNEMAFGLKLLEASMKQAGFNFHTKQWSATATPLKYAIISLYQGQTMRK
ncbi:hypothetical protein TYRP_000931 [Tyrophagus putrescentiae]|nr:hypothetical protein TYRP_000931 [Tyrophagus putrescentiae]